MAVSQRRRSSRPFLMLVLAVAALWTSMPALNFLDTMEWTDRGRLSKEDPLPLIAKMELGGLVNGTKAVSLAPSRGSFLADFGIIDLPELGEVRVRMGMRYSSLYPHGALELACRKEGANEKRGYEMFAGMQTTSDDSRLDLLCEAGAIKHFKDARVFYSFNVGYGGLYVGEDSWKDAGSSVGVVQAKLPPGEDGELTVGWRTRLLSGGDPNVLKFDESEFGRRNDEDFPLQSTPFCAYSVKLPVIQSHNLSLEVAAYPKHNIVHHTARLQVPTAQGQMIYSLAAEQCLSNPGRLRLRTGASFTSS